MNGLRTIRELLGFSVGALVALKLGHVIAWSWWWVLAPLWLPCAVAAYVFLKMAASEEFEDLRSDR